MTRRAEGCASREFPATKEGLAAAAGFLDGVVGEAGLADMPFAGKFGVILDELGSNVVRHSKAKTFSVAAEPLGGGRLRLRISDDGAPYDPFSRPDPDTTLPADERPVGGLGVFMVKNLAESTEYVRENGRNTTTAVACAAG